MDRENRECLNNNKEWEIVLHNCSKLKNIKVIKKIGQGEFSNVYLCIATIPSLKKRIRITVKVQQEEETEYFQELFDEIEYMYEMDRANIGPKMYDSFFIKKDNSLLQFAIKEYFDSTVENIFKKKTKREIKDDIVRQVLRLIHKQWFKYGLYCTDAKPDNFAYQYKTKQVRIIDFGANYCNKTFPNEFTIEQYFGLTLLMLLILLVKITKNVDYKPFLKYKSFKNLIRDKQLLKSMLLSKEVDEFIPFGHHVYWKIEFVKDKDLFIDTIYTLFTDIGIY